jgi:hypothetical protein
MEFPIESSLGITLEYPKGSILHQMMGVLEYYEVPVLGPREARQICKDILRAVSYAMDQVPQPIGRRIVVYEDGDAWCAMLEGDLLPDGESGFGTNVIYAVGELLEKLQESGYYTPTAQV